MTRTTGDLVGKDPASIEPWVMDWSAWLEELGGSPPAEIVTSNWRIFGKDNALTFQDASIVTGLQSTQLRLVGGTLGARYVVTNRIVASTGDTDEKSFKVLMRNG
jgi:hypothetical protein